GTQLLATYASSRDVTTIVEVDEGAVASVPPVALPGAHQRRNAAAALAAIDHLEVALGRRIDDAARARGLRDCRLAGRLERVATAPAVVIDGAHNPQAARVVAGALDDAAPGAARWVLVLGVSSDKDAAGIAAPLAARAAHVVVTRAAHDRALDPAALERAVRAVTAAPVEQAPDAASAIARARALAGHDGAVLVAGSLFLAGEARAHLLGEAPDPLPVSDPVR
ncbi:MAG TPA: cyanophycin synthetase, partial [Kofleriaceae bacterium]|nr:cyanophycin synthetase [Kofleriaceae bacterium]